VLAVKFLPGGAYCANSQQVIDDDKDVREEDNDADNYGEEEYDGYDEDHPTTKKRGSKRLTSQERKATNHFTCRQKRKKYDEPQAAVCRSRLFLFSYFPCNV